VGAAGADVAERGLAISKGLEGTAGDVWVAQYREQRIYKLNSSNGQLVPVNAQGEMFITLNWGAYGLIVDGKQRLYGKQRLWAVRPGVAEVAIIDTTNGSVITLSETATAGVTCGSYALGIDGKDRLWVAGWTAGSVACRYDRDTDTWTSFNFAGTQCVGGPGAAFGRPRGIAVNETGQVFMSADSPGAQLIRFDAETGAVIPFGTAACIDATDGNTASSIGVGLDGDGHPWVNNYTGNVMKIDKVTGAVTRTPQQPAGLYTYSDFTGYQLRKFTAPRGTFRKDYEGCGDMTGWAKLTWDADVPPGTALQVYIKVGATRAELDSSAAMRYGPFTTSPLDLLPAGIPKARFMRVEFVLLSTNGMSTPVLKGFDLNWSCVIEPG
jgi:streptogramin lyase